MDDPILILGLILGALVLAIGMFVLGFLYRKKVAEKKLGISEESAKRIIEEGERQAEALKKEALVEAKDEIFQLRSEMDQENKERRAEIQRTERRLLQKEENLDRKTQSLETREDKLAKSQKRLQDMQQEIEDLHGQQLKELERISALTEEEARTILLNNLEKELTHEYAMRIRDQETRLRNEADKKAREILSIAIQKTAADHVSESTVSVVELPNDEMKGRIIGREGRNIRTLETATGIDLIIDDTPEAVILSGFDPIRREIARVSLEKLVTDGRIHPARIEEMVEKARKEVETQIREAGEQSLFETNVQGIHPELVRLMGRLKFRTSYGQNVLKHSIEVSHLAGIMAAELGADVRLAKRAGLLHDIGKAVDHEVKGPHVQIGADLAKRYKETPQVINAIQAHHGDVEPTSVEAVLVQAADAISAARPGARRETIEAYIKRLEKLEEIANSFTGVEKSFAIQAGRELRIIVKPEKVTDDEAILMARDIVARVEKELEYPGQIKINVIREVRAVEFAK